MVKDSKAPPLPELLPAAVVPAWFLEMYKDSFRTLTKKAMLLGGTLEEAQDAAQAALTDLLERALKGADIRHPGAYARMAMYRYLIGQRERDRKQIRNLIQRGHAYPAAFDDPAMIIWEEQEVVGQLLARLPPTQRAVMTAALEGLSISEIAQILAKSPDSVRKNLQLARDRLRVQLIPVPVTVHDPPAPRGQEGGLR